MGGEASSGTRAFRQVEKGKYDKCRYAHRRFGREREYPIYASGGGFVVYAKRGVGLIVKCIIISLWEDIRSPNSFLSSLRVGLIL